MFKINRPKKFIGYNGKKYKYQVILADTQKNFMAMRVKKKMKMYYLDKNGLEIFKFDLDGKFKSYRILEYNNAGRYKSLIVAFHDGVYTDVHRYILDTKNRSVKHQALIKGILPYIKEVKHEGKHVLSFEFKNDTCEKLKLK